MRSDERKESEVEVEVEIEKVRVRERKIMQEQQSKPNYPMIPQT